MRSLSKVCDGADWFDPELKAVIDGDLRELARFHRKQWEFAMILLALRRRGALRPDAVGLSMGAGKERLLYAVAHTRPAVVATDLYDLQTEWETAHTGDPDRYIKEGKPFPVDDAKLRGLRMDMRSLDFRGGDLRLLLLVLRHRAHRGPRGLPEAPLRGAPGAQGRRRLCPDHRAPLRAGDPRASPQLLLLPCLSSRPDRGGDLRGRARDRRPHRPPPDQLPAAPEPRRRCASRGPAGSSTA